MLEQASVEEMFQKYGEMLYKICIVIANYILSA